MPNLAIKATASKKTAEVYIYDQIGAGWFEEGIEASKLVPQLAALDVTTLNVRINSPGGDYFDGVTIYNALLRHPATVNVFVDGLAASAASVIAMAGHTIHMAANALMMIHQAQSIAVGTADDLRAKADLLDIGNQAMADVYAKRTGQTVAKCHDLMAAETWMTAEEALTLGFSDQTDEAMLEAAFTDTARLRAMGYQHVPQLPRRRVAAIAATARPQWEMRAASIQKVKKHLVSRS